MNLPSLSIHLPSIPAWLAALSTLTTLCLKQPAIVCQALERFSHEAKWVGSAFKLLKGARTMSLEPQKILAVLPFLPDAIKAAQEATDANLTDAQKEADIVPLLAADLPKLFAEEGASPALVAALGNESLYEGMFAVRQAIQAMLPTLEALFAQAAPAPAPAEEAPAADEAPVDEQAQAEPEQVAQTSAMPQ